MVNKLEKIIITLIIFIFLGF